MTYGRLAVFCGPMYAGKSTALLRRILWDRHVMKRVIVVKPAFDNRYAETKIVSHDGLASEALSIAAWNEADLFRDFVPERIYIDEIQFFQEPHFAGDIAAIVRTLLGRGIDVVVGGLDMDWQGKAFPVTAALCAMADEITKLTANCTQCGRPATKTYKKTKAGGSVELGATDLYESRCNHHWT